MKNTTWIITCNPEDLFCQLMPEFYIYFLLISGGWIILPPKTISGFRFQIGDIFQEKIHCTDMIAVNMIVSISIRLFIKSMITVYICNKFW